MVLTRIEAAAAAAAADEPPPSRRKQCLVELQNKLGSITDKQNKTAVCRNQLAIVLQYFVLQVWARSALSQ